MIEHAPATFDLTDPNWIAAGIAGLVAIVAGIFRVWSSIFKRTIYRHHNLTLRIINHMPPDHIIFDGLQVFPLGEIELYIMVFGSYRAIIEKMAIRCLNRDLSDADRNTIQITSMDYWNDRYISEFVAHPDAVGGIGGTLTSPRSLRPKEGLYFRLRINARQSWTGILSFRSTDRDAFESYARNTAIAVGLQYEEAIKVMFSQP